MRRHDTDVTSLVFGLIFLGVTALWVLNQSTWVDVPDLSVLGPALLVVAGFIGLAATLGASARSRNREVAAVPAAAPEPAVFADAEKEDDATPEREL